MKKRTEARVGKRQTSHEAWWIDWAPPVYSGRNHGGAFTKTGAAILLSIALVLLLVAAGTTYGLTGETKGQLAVASSDGVHISDAVPDALCSSDASELFRKFVWVVVDGLLAESR